MIDVEAKFNEWAATMGEGHDKHLTIRCGYANPDVDVISHNRGIIDRLTRIEAYHVCKEIVETHDVVKRVFTQRNAVPDIEVALGELHPNIAFIGTYVPMGEGFIMSLSGTLSKNEVKDLQGACDKEVAEHKRRWDLNIFNR